MCHLEHLARLTSLADARALDIGAGDGTYARQLYDAGARVVAVEVEEAKVAKYRAGFHDLIDVRLGGVQELPVEIASQTLCCLFF